MKIITLPDRDDMLKRLLKVSNDSLLQERFYPSLLEQAGQELVAPHGIVMMMELAIQDYIKGVSLIIASQLYMQAPDFIDALVSDAEIAKEAKSLMREILFRD